MGLKLMTFKGQIETVDHTKTADVWDLIAAALKGQVDIKALEVSDQGEATVLSRRQTIKRTD